MLEKDILKLLESNRDKGMPFKVILHSFPLGSINRTHLKRVLDKMFKEGLLRMVREHYFLNPKISKVEVKQRGKIIRGKIGVGKGQKMLFTTFDLGESLVVYPENLANAIAGDTVDAIILERKSKSAKVIKIIKRINKPILLEVKKQKLYPRIAMPLPIKLADKIPADGWYHAITSDLIFDNYIQVKITQKVSDFNDLDFFELIEQFDLPHKFSEATLKEASIAFSEHILRTNLKDLYTFTIDGSDAKDFDDAISLVKENNDFRLFVHIADVSSHVKSNSNLDKEALLRGTSVYFPGHVIPMLPENLSNNLCSLMPNQVRKALTCEMLLSSRGTVKEAYIYPSFIESNRRFTYVEVSEILNKLPNDPDLEILKDCYNCFKVLLKSRIKSGAIDFDLKEEHIILDEKGGVKDITRKERLTSMQIIEEFMLVANQTIAKALVKLKIEAPFRHHPAPLKEKVIALNEVLRSVKIKNTIKEAENPKVWQELIDSIPDDLGDFLKPLVLRSMQQAIYTPENSSHFGLAKEFYCHFTSPIRRYPDLMVHRQLHRLIKNSNQTKLKIHPLGSKLIKYAKFKTPEDMAKISLKCSRRERKAIEAEREYNQRKKAEFLKAYLGSEFLARISGITRNGLYLELERFPIEGFLSFDDLPGFWTYNEKTQTATNKSLKSLRMGQALNIKIKAIDILRARIDFSYLSGITF